MAIVVPPYLLRTALSLHAAGEDCRGLVYGRHSSGAGGAIGVSATDAYSLNVRAGLLF